MNSLLAFVGVLGGIVVLGKIVSKITGSKAYSVETFPLEAGERLLWEDASADAYPVPTRRALFVTYRRSRRGAVRVTTRRIIAGTKPLFGSNHLVQHVLYPADRSLPEEAHHIGGGLLTRGFQVLVFQRSTLEMHLSDAPPFVELDLDPAFPSSLNLARYRIHSDGLSAFRLPE